LSGVFDEWQKRAKEKMDEAELLIKKAEKQLEK